MDLKTATLRWLNDSAGYGIITTDAGLNIRGWNRWLEEHSGRSAAQMIGQNLLAACPELVERRLDRYYHQALSGQVAVLSQRFHHYLLPLPVQRRLTGFGQMQQTASIAPLEEEDQIIGTITTIEDITDRVAHEEELRRRLAIQDALHEIDRAILTLDLPECLQRVVDKTAALVGAPAAAVVLREGDALRVAASTHAPHPEQPHCLDDQSVAAWATRSRQAILLPDVREPPTDATVLRPLYPDSRSVVAAPLMVEDEAIGALIVESPRPDAFGEAEEELVVALAIQAAVAIYNARLHTALNDERRLLRTLIDTMPDLIYVKDTESRFVTANLATAHSLGKESPAELTGKTDFDFHPLELTTQYRADEQAIIESGRPLVNKQELVMDPEGKRHWYLSSKVPLRDSSGEITGLVGVNRDITERVQVELENARLLTETQRRAKMLALVNQIGQEMIRLRDVSTLLNEAATHIVEALGYYSANILLVEDGDLALATGHGGYTGPTPTGYRQPLGVGIIGQAAQSGQSILVSDVTADPRYLPFEGLPLTRSELAVPLRSDERVLGVLDIQSHEVNGLDELDRHMLETVAGQLAQALENAQLYERIRRHAAELEQRVRERTAELEAANATLRENAEELQRLSRLKSEFVANVSHGLRTPLTNIKLMLVLLEKGKPEKREYYWRTLTSETDLLEQLIEDLLHLSRMELGQTQPYLIPVDLNDAVGILANGRIDLFAQRGLKLQLETEPGLPPVLTDPKMLAEVLTNLMTNAMNYTPRGGTVTVRTAMVQQPASGGKEGKEPGEPRSVTSWLTLSVSDTGLGIPPEERTRIFERFFRGEIARTTGAPGTGLGLAICQEIVERLGGKITLESEVGQGSTFTVWLPVVDQAQDQSSQEKMP